MKRKRKLSPAWRSLQAMWFDKVLPRLDRFEKKLDKLANERKTQLKSRIGFEHPTAEDE